MFSSSAFEAVQTKLNEQLTNHKSVRMKSGAILAGRTFDDHGHRMTPSHARKHSVKYRYYISAALIQGQQEQAGSVSRVPAPEIEALIIKTVRAQLGQLTTSMDDAALVRDHVARIEVHSGQLVVELSPKSGVRSQRKLRGHRIKILCPKTLDQFAQKIAPSSLPRLPEADAGSKKLSKTPGLLLILSLHASTAAYARST